MRHSTRIAATGALLAALFPATATGQISSRPALSQSDIADIATLLLLEDNRRFDSTALARVLRAPHPELRRRAALSIGRIANPAGRALLRDARGDRDTAVAATVVFATAQLYDSAAVPWLDSLLTAPNTPPTVATEAARAFGLIRTPETRAALARFLASAAANARNAPIVGEALLSIGRHARGDLSSVVKWTTSRDVEVRWRATWALFRPRDPAAVSHLLGLTADRDAAVRNWAVRGLTWPQVDSSGVDPARVRSRLRAMLGDADRTVRTEALRALATHPDIESVNAVARALDSDDAWASVSAAEGLGTQRTHAAVTVPRLVAAATKGGSCARRSVALTAINTLAPDSGFAPAAQMARDTAVLCRTAAITFLRTKGDRARDVLAPLVNDSVAAVSTAAQQAVAALSDASAGRGGRGGGRGRGRAGGGGGRGRGDIVTGRTEADYRRIVEQWIVPDYEGRPRPRAEWTTPRGTIEIELYPGDAPIATDWFVRAVNDGTIVGVDFSRVVPDFVDQQRGITGAPVFRDEVNRHRLTRANVSWASAGLDTGRPGYTLNHTPQPHNEGSFTSLGRVVRGMDAVDRIELGDRILSTRMIPSGR